MDIAGIDWHIWMTILLIGGMFVTLFKSKIPADVVFLSVMALLILTGCIEPTEALNSFGASSVVEVGTLFVIVAGLDATGVLQWMVKNLLGTPKSYTKTIVRLMLPVALLSAFLSNTTVVAFFIKVVKMWAKKLHIAPSKLLIPLSYAAGMGGVCTLIGTPPNLIIAGFYADNTHEHLSIFSTLPAGLFCLSVGVISIILLQRLLPSRKTPEEELSGEPHTITTELKVPTHSHLPGQTLADMHLREECHNCQLIGIIHFDGELEQVLPDSNLEDFIVMGCDTFVFKGDKEEIMAFGRRYNMECDKIDYHLNKTQNSKTFLSAFIMMGMVMLSAFNILPLLNSCLIAALLMLLTRCCNTSQAKRAINWDVLMIFACSVAFGKAIDHTGLAQMLAADIGALCESNALIAFILICTVGTFLTEFVSNTACGAIMAPIALQIATNMGANPITFCIGLMISVSSSFATPIGSPTHLMVYVPGGYRFNDFLRIGLPMNFIILAANIFITLLLFPL